MYVREEQQSEQTQQGGGLWPGYNFFKKSCTCNSSPWLIFKNFHSKNALLAQCSIYKQAEKLKSHKMKDEWWKMKDERWKMKDEGSLL